MMSNSIGKSGAPEAPRAVITDIAKARERVAAKAAAAGDASGFSQGARELVRANEAVREAPEVRTERVLALRKQIENGSYEIDARSIAKKLMEQGI